MTKLRIALIYLYWLTGRKTSSYLLTSSWYIASWQDNGLHRWRWFWLHYIKDENDIWQNSDGDDCDENDDYIDDTETSAVVIATKACVAEASDGAEEYIKETIMIGYLLLTAMVLHSCSQSRKGFLNSVIMQIQTISTVGR